MAHIQARAFQVRGDRVTRDPDELAATQKIGIIGRGLQS